MEWNCCLNMLPCHPFWRKMLATNFKQISNHLNLFHIFTFPLIFNISKSLIIFSNAIQNGRFIYWDNLFGKIEDFISTSSIDSNLPKATYSEFKASEKWLYLKRYETNVSSLNNSIVSNPASTNSLSNYLIAHWGNNTPKRKFVIFPIPKTFSVAGMVYSHTFICLW